MSISTLEDMDQSKEIYDMNKKDLNSVLIKNEHILKGLEIMPGGFMVYKGFGKGEIIYVNKALIMMYDCETEEDFMKLTGGTYTGMIYEEDLPEVQEGIRRQFERNDDRFERLNYRIKTKSGNIKYVEDFGRYSEDTVEGQICYAFISDLEQVPDVLTGLPNRNVFLNRAEKYAKACLESHKNVFMISFNLSGIKGFNARNGIREGDRFLCIFADILRKYFPDENCSRFGEDKFFAFSDDEELKEKLEDLIQDLEGANGGKTLPVKIGYCKMEEGMTVHLACDYARMACEAQKSHYGSRCGSFNESMAQRYVKADYILSHFDQALDEGWIHIYLQPVVRTLTENVCGYEALARWIDPVYGFISPGDFVPILEENGLSYKLDTFVVKRVAELQARKQKQGNPVVPVSVNISRSDFDSCSPVDVIVGALDEYDLRRSCICVEITESALMNNEEVIKKEINRFNEAGIEVWMDDFGSGFSSLNLLKDYHFDEIKIDMLFLRDFSEKSKIIMTMAVRMAKELNIHTLAEGVENEEQIRFLKSIGCEKIQGYYYSKPLPVKEVDKHLSEKGLSFETREERSVYEKTGLIDVVTQQALGLLFFDGASFKVMYCNKECHETAVLMNEGKEVDIERVMNSKGSIVNKRLIDLSLKAQNSQHDENMTIIANGRYFRFTFRKVAESRQGSMILCIIDGKQYEEQELQEKYDSIMRNVVSIYDCIYVLDFINDTRTVIYSNLPYEKVGSVINGLHEFYQDYSPRFIHPDDVNRWYDFIRADNYRKKILEQADARFFDAFRVKHPDGSYKWTEFQIVLISDVDNRKALICEKPFEIEKISGIFKDKVKKSRPGEEGYNINDDLITAIRHHSDIRFFWKDRNRRFLGVTDAFLRYYGFKSQDAVLGKTDEDVGWHIDDTPFKSDEERVLEEGEIIRKNVGQNVVDGVTHYIAATKFPVYNNGEIIGLMGYMIDIEQDIESKDDLKRESLIDPVTGFMNAYGQILTLTQLDDNLRTNGEAFAYIVLEVPEFEDISVDYGREIAEKLVKTVSELLVSCFGHVASIFRMYGCHFGIAKRNMSSEEIRETAETWQKGLRSIREIDGRQVRIHGEFAYAQGTEKETMQEIVELASRRLNEKLSGTDERSDEKTELIKGYLNRMPLPYLVTKLIMDEEGKTPVDLELLYANKRFCEITEKSPSLIIGKRYTEVFHSTKNQKWLDIGYRAASGEYIYSRTYSYSMKHWVNFIAAPSTEAGTFSTVFIKMFDADKQSEEPMAEHIVNEIGSKDKMMRSDKRDGSIRTLIMNLKKSIKADRIFIMELMGDNKISNTFEWCADGVESVMDQWQNLDLGTYVTRNEEFLPGTSRVVKNVENCKYINPKRADLMSDQGIRSYIEIPFYNNGKLFGFIGVDNYKVEDEENVKLLLEHASYFLEFNEEIRRVEAQKPKTP